MIPTASPTSKPTTSISTLTPATSNPPSPMPTSTPTATLTIIVTITITASFPFNNRIDRHQLQEVCLNCFLGSAVINNLCIKHTTFYSWARKEWFTSSLADRDALKLKWLAFEDTKFQVIVLSHFPGCWLIRPTWLGLSILSLLDLGVWFTSWCLGLSILLFDGSVHTVLSAAHPFVE